MLPAAVLQRTFWGNLGGVLSPPKATVVVNEFTEQQLAKGENCGQKLFKLIGPEKASLSVTVFPPMTLGRTQKSIEQQICPKMHHMDAH